MRRLLPLIVAVLLIPAGASLAQPRAGQTILAGCRQGGCVWLRVARVEPMTRGPQGALVRMVSRRGSSTHRDGELPRRSRDARIEWERADGTSYAFCSTRRPAYAFESEDQGLVVHFLDLFDLAGYQYSSAGMYMRLCHGRTSLPSAGALRRLGYRPGTRSEQIENGSQETMTRF